MTEATGFEAKTIHRLLEVHPKSGGFKRGEDNPLVFLPKTIAQVCRLTVHLLMLIFSGSFCSWRRMPCQQKSATTYGLINNELD